MQVIKHCGNTGNRWDQLVNIADHMNYDPYLGRVTEASPPPPEPETYPEEGKV
jgi:hypothetical protein